MLTGIDSLTLYSSLSDYSLYNNVSSSSLYSNPYINNNPVDSIQGLQPSFQQLQSSIDDFEGNIENLETAAVDLEQSLNSGKEIQKNTEAFVESYNTTLNYLQNSNNLNSIEAADDLSDQAEIQEEDLAQIGIEVDEFGQLSINEETFKQSLAEEPEKVENVLGGETGFVEGVKETLDDIRSQPTSAFINWNSGFELYTDNNVSTGLLQSGMLLDIYS